MARYGLFVLKVPLNPNQLTNRIRPNAIQLMWLIPSNSVSSRSLLIIFTTVLLQSIRDACPRHLLRHFTTLEIFHVPPSAFFS